MVFVKFHNMNRKKKISNVAFKLKLKKCFTLQQVKTILQSQFTIVQFSFLLFSIYVLSILLKMSPLSFFLSFFFFSYMLCSTMFKFFFLCHFHCPVAFCFCFGFLFFFFIINCLFNVPFFPTLYLPLSVLTLIQ